MNRVLVAGIAGFAMLVSAGFTTQDCYAARKCSGNSGGLFSGAGGDNCGGRAPRQRPERRPAHPVAARPRPAAPAQPVAAR